MAAAIPGVTLDPALVAKFVNPLPSALAPAFVYAPSGTTTATLQNGQTATVPLYDVGAYRIQQSLGLGTYGALGIIPPAGKTVNDPVVTTVYGYGKDAASATYPGRTFEVQSNQAIAVNYVNGLTDANHLLPVDPTVLDMTDQGMASYTTTAATVANTPVTGTTQALFATFNNGIPIVPHLHGGHTQAAWDGTPMQWFTPNPAVHGSDFVGNTFVYDNTQQAATIWYHDHAMGITRLNVYAGLAGFYIVHDAKEQTLINNRVLPNKTYDYPLVIQDRMFTVDGQLYYPADVLPGTTATYPSNHPEFFGDTILVNGKTWPVLNVEPRMYRFRLLDGSQARFYNLQLATSAGVLQPFFQIASDDGLLTKPVSMTQLLVSPGERAEIVVDFAKLAGQTIILQNNAKGPYPKGASADPRTTGRIMAFQVSLPKDTTIPDATLNANSTLNAITRFTAGANPTQLSLLENTDAFLRLQQVLGTPTGGYRPFMGSAADPLANAETVQLGSDGTATVTWRIYNNTMDTHPIHLHQVSFQLIQRQAFSAVVDPVTGIMSKIKLKGVPTLPAPNEAGWKDTVQMHPGTVTTIVAKFDLPGKYVWHCHILEHEEHDMMHWLNVLPQTVVPRAPLTATSSRTGSTKSSKTGRGVAALPPLAVQQVATRKAARTSAQRGNGQAIDQILAKGWNLAVGRS